MKTIQDEITQKHQDLFNEFNNSDLSFSQISVKNGEIALSQQSIINEGFPDKILKAVKLIFFFVPGVFLLSFIGPALFLSILFGNFLEPLLGLLVFGGVGSFLTMLGIGKLTDLSYLKVPAFAALLSMVIGFLFLPIAFYFGYDLGILKFILPLEVVLAYLAKRNIDKSGEKD